MDIHDLEPISIKEIKDKKFVKSFEDLKLNLSNNLLIYLQFDLPRDFNLLDLSQIAYNFRFMKNFSRSYSFEQSKEFLRNQLREFFNLSLIEEKKTKKKLIKSKKLNTSFKQVFFDIGEERKDKIIIEDTTNFDLQKASLESIKEVITDFENSSLGNNAKIKSTPNLLRDISSKNSISDQDRYEQTPSELKIEQDEVLELMKTFSISQTIPKQIESDTEVDKEDKLNETMRMLGIGNIKKNLGKTIISKKRKEGLLFDEWINEKLDWVQYLIKKLAHIDYLSLKEEAEYLTIVHNYKFSDTFEKELKKLYSVLCIDSNEE